MNEKLALISIALAASLILAGCLGQGSYSTTAPGPSSGQNTLPQATVSVASATTEVVTPANHFNSNGDFLISDQYNNRVIEVNPSTGNIVWSFGSNNASLCNPGPGAIIGTNWAERLSNNLTLIAGTGIPPGADAALPGGCADNRVIVVNETGGIVWQYGQANVTGSGPNELSVPVSAVQLQNGDFLITDQGNNRVIEVNPAGSITWSYGPANGTGALNSPNSAELLANGDMLIADEANNRVIEVARNGTIVWQYSGGISGAAFASRLPDGSTLITDTGNARVFIVNTSGSVTWQYFTNSTVGSNPAPLTTNAVELSNGNFMIADQFNHRVIEVSPQGNVTWQYGVTNSPGNGPGMLNGPYTAFVVGDYTGQTPPA